MAGNSSKDSTSTFGRLTETATSYLLKVGSFLPWSVPFFPKKPSSELLNLHESGSLELCISTPNRPIFNVVVSLSSTVEDVKLEVEKLEGTPVWQQSLVLGGRTLLNSMSMTDVGASHLCTLNLGFVQEDMNDCPLLIDRKYLAPEYNYDFLDVRKDLSDYERGNEVYKRPYGWYRYALNVIGKYSDDTWLGCSGDKHLIDSGGEWPVAYHGTNLSSAQSIAQVGYDLSKCKNNLTYGKGIYTSPCIDVAMHYTKDFTFKGKKCKIIIQNRVNPKTVKKYRTGTSRGSIWVSQCSEDVRPYGILVRTL